MPKYAVKVVGHGIVFRTVDRASAHRRAAICVPEAQAKVLTIGDWR